MSDGRSETEAARGIATVRGLLLQRASKAEARVAELEALLARVAEERCLSLETVEAIEDALAAGEREAGGERCVTTSGAGSSNRCADPAGSLEYWLQRTAV